MPGIIILHHVACLQYCFRIVSICGEPNTAMPPALADLMTRPASSYCKQHVERGRDMQDFVVVLDERGKTITSEGLAELIAKVGLVCLTIHPS